MVFGSIVGYDCSYYNSPPGVYTCSRTLLAARSHHMYGWYDETELVEVLGPKYMVNARSVLY